MSDYDHLLLPGFYALVCELKKELIKNEEISSWQNLMSLRVRVNEKIEKKFNQELSQYEEKISMKKLFHQCDVPTTRVCKTTFGLLNLRGYVLVHVLK